MDALIRMQNHKFEMFFPIYSKSARQTFLVFRYFVFHMPQLMVIVLVFLDAIAIARNLGSSDFNVSRLSPQF